jgi:mono/diheme cytochrome c family protein
MRIGRGACGAALVLLLGSSAKAAAPDGRALYEAKCTMCHGKNGVAKPVAKGSRNLNDPAWQEAATLESIAKVILQGKGTMPKYDDKLTVEEIKAIAAHVKTLR